MKLVRTAGVRGCNGKEEGSQEPEFRIQEEDGEQNTQPQMDADLRRWAKRLNQRSGRSSRFSCKILFRWLQHWALSLVVLSGFKPKRNHGLPPITSHQSLLTSHASLASVMFELIDDDGADDDAAFDDLLPVSGNIGQVEDVI